MYFFLASNVYEKSPLISLSKKLKISYLPCGNTSTIREFVYSSTVSLSLYEKLKKNKFILQSSIRVYELMSWSQLFNNRIQRHPADSIICFANTYPLVSDLSDGQRYVPPFEQLAPG